MERNPGCGDLLLPGAVLADDEAELLEVVLHDAEGALFGHRAVPELVGDQGLLLARGQTLPGPLLDADDRKAIGHGEDPADLARRFSKPVTLGSDAHVASEIGSVQVRLDRATLRCENVITTRYSTEQEIRRSRVTSLIRQGKWGTLILGGLVATGKRLWY